MSDEVRVEPLDLMAHAAQAEEVLTAALATVAATTGTTGTDGVHFETHVQRHGFRARGAWLGDRLLGFTYAIDAKPDSWWDSWIRPALTESGHADLMADCLELVELHVRPDWHGRGLGTRLLRAVTDGAAQPRVLLTTQDGPNPARAFYRARGFTELAPVPLGDARYLVLAADLPLR